jgi:phosphatidylglycerophosphate synthase
MLSIAFALAGAWALVGGGAVGWLGAVACIQGRLLCNLFDGMVAVEHDRASPVGVLFNEFPDRIADSALLVALGYASHCTWLGWLCALLAALTAYVRVFGGSLGQAQTFGGPMAKQHRMAVMTIALLLMALDAWWLVGQHAVVIGTVALAIIAIGSGITCITRTLHIARQLNQSAP